MADTLRKVGTWLGLVTEDRYDPKYDPYDTRYEQTGDFDFREDETEVVASSRTWSEPAGEAAAVSPANGQSAPRPTTRADLARITTVTPRTYNEARTIGENFRDGIPVIMNLSEMDDGDAKRLVDFAAGLIFGMRGSIERVTSKVFLLSPPNVKVAAEDKERIVGGFFNQS